MRKGKRSTGNKCLTNKRLQSGETRKLQLTFARKRF